MVSVKSGPYEEVVLIGRLFIVKNFTAVMLSGGLYREVVFIERWSLVEVLLYLNTAEKSQKQRENLIRN